MTVRDVLLAAIADCALYNSTDVIAPSAILWPDEEGLWELAIGSLAPERPLLTLGDYDPDREQGPSAWIRVRLRELAINAEEGAPVPLVYLPGVPRRNLSDAGSLATDLQPLAGLALRCAVFAQRNGTDWTPTAFFVNRSEGVGLKVAGDRETKEALSRNLGDLLDAPIDDLRNRTLTSVDFDHQVIEDAPRLILRWMDDPKEFETATRTDGKWKNFVTVVSKDYKVHPERDGVLIAGEQLGERKGKWSQVWSRFAESPSSHLGVVEVLRRSRPEGLLVQAHPESWPQENEEQESQAEQALRALVGQPTATVRQRLAELEATHAGRREWVWARMGQAPFADLLSHFAELADRTREPGYGATVDELAQLYTTDGWRADRAFVECLAALSAGHEARSAVASVAEALYRPWLEEVATRFQNAWESSGAVPTRRAGPDAQEPDGTCVMFIDGLRFDVAWDLADTLAESDLSATLDWGLAGVPSVTGTCKPAVSPVADQLGPGKDLEPSAPNGVAWNQNQLRKLLEASGWDLVPSDSTGRPGGRGWTEGGDIDKLGHAVGINLAGRLRDEVRAISQRIQQLIAAGWRRVLVVTDHGWILLPGTLPKQELPEHLTEIRKGRCARMSEGVDGGNLGIRVLPWRWDDAVAIAVSNSIHAFEAGKVYEHGGLSPQECVVPVLAVETARADDDESASPTANVGIDIQWSGLRVKFTLSGVPDGTLADLRARAGDPASSLARAA